MENKPPDNNSDNSVFHSFDYLREMANNQSCPNLNGDQNQSIGPISNPAIDLSFGASATRDSLLEELHIDIELAKTTETLKELANRQKRFKSLAFLPSRPTTTVSSDRLTLSHSFSNQVSSNPTNIGHKSDLDFIYDSSRHKPSNQSDLHNFDHSNHSSGDSVDKFARPNAGNDSGLSFDSEESACGNVLSTKRSCHEDEQSEPQLLSDSLECSRMLISSAIKDSILLRSNGGKAINFLSNFVGEGANLPQQADHDPIQEDGELSDEMLNNSYDCPAFEPRSISDLSFSASVDQRVDQMYFTHSNQPIISSPQMAYTSPNPPIMKSTPYSQTISQTNYHPNVFGTSGKQPTINYPNSTTTNYMNFNRNTDHQPAAENYPPSRPIDHQVSAVGLFSNSNNIFSQPMAPAIQPIQSALRVPTIPQQFAPLPAVSLKRYSPTRAAPTNEDENAEIKNLIFNKLSKSHKKNHSIDKTQDRKLIKVLCKSMDFDHCNRFSAQCLNSGLPHDQDGYNVVYNFKSSDKVFKNKENRQVLFDRLVNAQFFDKNENRTDDPLRETFDLNEEITQNEIGLFEEDELLDNNEVNQIMGDVFNDVSSSDFIPNLSPFNQLPDQQLDDILTSKPACPVSSPSMFPVPVNDPRLNKRIQDPSQITASPLSNAYDDQSGKKLIFGDKNKGKSASSFGVMNNSPNTQSSVALNRPKRSCQIKSPPFQMDYCKMLDLQVKRDDLKRLSYSKRNDLIDSVLPDCYVRTVKPGIAKDYSFSIVRIHQVIKEEPRKRLVVVCPDYSNKVIEFSSVSSNSLTEDEFNVWRANCKKYTSTIPSKEDYEQKKFELLKAVHQVTTPVKQIRRELLIASKEPKTSGREPPEPAAASKDQLQKAAKTRSKQSKSSEDNKLFKEFDTLIRPSSKKTVRQPVASKNLHMNDCSFGEEFTDLRQSAERLRFSGNKETAATSLSPKKRSRPFKKPLQTVEPAKVIKKSLIQKSGFSSVSSDSDDSFDLKPAKQPAKVKPSSSSEASSDEPSCAGKKTTMKRDRKQSFSSSSDESDDDLAPKSKHQKRSLSTSDRNKNGKQPRNAESTSSDDLSSTEASEHAVLRTKKSPEKRYQGSTGHRERHRHFKVFGSRSRSSSDDSASESIEDGLLNHSSESEEDEDLHELQLKIKKLKEEALRIKKNKEKKRANSSAPKESNNATVKPTSSTSAKSPAFHLLQPPNLIKFRNSPRNSSENSGSGAERQSTARSTMPSVAEKKGTASFYQTCYSDSSEHSPHRHDESRSVSGKNSGDKASRKDAKLPLKAKKIETVRIKEEQLEPEGRSKLMSFAAFEKHKSAIKAVSEVQRVSHIRNEPPTLPMATERLLIQVKLAKQALETGDRESCRKKLNKLAEQLYGEDLRAGCVDEIDIEWLKRSGIDYDPEAMRRTSSYRTYLEKKYPKRKN